MKFSMLFVLLSISSALTAESFNKENFNYIKELNPTSISSSARWGSFDLDQEIYRSSFYNDLILTVNGTQIPYSRNIKTDLLGSTGSVAPIVLFSKKQDQKMIYVLEIPKIPGNTQMGNLVISSYMPFESDIRYYLGNEIDKWEIERNSFLYNYKSKDLLINSSLVLSTKYYRYLRIETSSIEELSFTRLEYEKIGKTAEIQFDTEIPSPKNDTDLNASVYYFENPSSHPFRKIELDFNEPSYNRTYEVYKLADDKEYEMTSSGRLIKNQDNISSQNAININNTISSAWKLIVYYDDNPPLTLTKATLFHPQEEILFPLNDINIGNKDEKILLYYGYKYAKHPKYDLTDYPDTALNTPILKFNVSEETINPDKTWSVFYPPVSIWIIRFLFILGIAFVGYYSYLVLQKWIADVNSLK